MLQQYMLVHQPGLRLALAQDAAGCSPNAARRFRDWTKRLSGSWFQVANLEQQLFPAFQEVLQNDVQVLPALMPLSTVLHCHDWPTSLRAHKRSSLQAPPTPNRPVAVMLDAAWHMRSQRLHALPSQPAALAT